MKPLGNKILVRDIKEEKITSGGIILKEEVLLKKVKIERVSEDTQTKLQPNDICLCENGGVEIEKGLWLCNENILWAKL